VTDPPDEEILPERHETPRKALERHLRRESLSAGALARLLDLREAEVVAHLEHLERSLRGRGGRLAVDPPRCRSCGYAFPGRRRLGRPSSCPRCRHQRIEPPAFRIEAGR